MGQCNVVILSKSNYNSVSFSRTKYEKSNDDDANIPSSTHENQVPQNSAPQQDNIQSSLAGKHGFDVSGRLFDGLGRQAQQRRGSSSGSINLPDAYFLPVKDERFDI